MLATLALHMQAVAVGWQLYSLTGSAFDLGLVGLVQFVPTIVLTLVVGHVAEAFYPHVPLGVGRVLKAMHNCLFYLLNKLDRFDRYRIFSRGYYALVEK